MITFWSSRSAFSTFFSQSYGLIQKQQITWKEIAHNEILAPALIDGNDAREMCNRTGSLAKEQYFSSLMSDLAQNQRYYVNDTWP